MKKCWSATVKTQKGFNCVEWIFKYSTVFEKKIFLSISFKSSLTKAKARPIQIVIRFTNWSVALYWMWHKHNSLLLYFLLLVIYIQQKRQPEKIAVQKKILFFKESWVFAFSKVKNKFHKLWESVKCIVGH